MGLKYTSPGRRQGKSLARARAIQAKLKGGLPIVTIAVPYRDEGYAVWLPSGEVMTIQWSTDETAKDMFHHEQ